MKNAFIFSDFLYLFFEAKFNSHVVIKLEKENGEFKKEIEEFDDDLTNAGNLEAVGTETAQRVEKHVREDNLPP